MEKFQQVETNQEISNYDNPQDYSDEKVENINEKTIEMNNKSFISSKFNFK